MMYNEIIADIYEEEMYNAVLFNKYGWPNSSEICWDYNHVFDAIKKLKNKSIPIVGGDVCILKNKKIEYTYNTWNTDLSKEETTYEQTIDYINNFIDIVKCHNSYLFVLVCDYSKILRTIS